MRLGLAIRERQKILFVSKLNFIIFWKMLTENIFLNLSGICETSVILTCVFLSATQNSIRAQNVQML